MAPFLFEPGGLLSEAYTFERLLWYKKTCLPAPGLLSPKEVQSVPKFTSHALKRSAQRGLRQVDLLYVWRHGTRYRVSTKALVVYLRRRDIPKRDRAQWGRLEGTCLVLTPDGMTVLTVYRNRRRMPRAK